MRRRALDLESIALAAYAAIPLYFTQAISIPVTVVFHLALLAVALSRQRGEGGPVARAMLKFSAVAYLLFVPLDALVISQSAVRVSTHLLLFLAVYQAAEQGKSMSNERQRLLVIFLIFITSLATSTDLTVVAYILGFVFLAYRHLIRIAHRETIDTLGVPASRIGSAPSALRLLVGTLLIAALLFPILPRARDPFVRGLPNTFNSSSTGVSDSIDFSVARSISPDGDVVARVWMPREAALFFAPVRLKARVYDTFIDNRWSASRQPYGELGPELNGSVRVARGIGFSRTVRVQQAVGDRSEIYLPVGAHTVFDLPELYEGRNVGAYHARGERGGVVSYRAALSREVAELEPLQASLVTYPVTSEVLALARRITEGAPDPVTAASQIEMFLLQNYRYVANPADLGKPLTIEEFLLTDRRGHCEYFAAGMVVMATAVGIPARIVGGYHGGQLNPVTGYFVVRKSDAHAWVDIHDGEKWRTFDPTPPSLRPGNVGQGVLRAYATALTDSVSYFWDRYILTFGIADQMALLTAAVRDTRDALVTAWRARESVASAARALPLLPIGLGIALGVFLVLLVRHLRRPLFVQLAARLRATGIEIDDSATPGEIVATVRRERPELAVAVELIVDTYVRDRFSALGAPPEMRTTARRALAQL
jgi:transglutaminase-like putative cysteine protease